MDKPHSSDEVVHNTLFPQKVLVGLLTCCVVAWTASQGGEGRFWVVVVFLLLGPGYLIERILPIAHAHSDQSTPVLFVRPAVWVGLSLSIVALLYEWATVIGLRLTPTVVGVLAILCGLGVAWQLWCQKWHPEISPSEYIPMHSETWTKKILCRTLWCPQAKTQADKLTHHQIWFSMLLIFSVALWLRFVHIQGLVMPAWVDSVHHALLIRVVNEQGQAPYSLHPYLPVDNLPYHWGYHVFTATVVQLSGMSIPQAMLWEGQILNALHVLTSAALAAFFWRRWQAGIMAGIVVGLVSIMPAYYVSWGRYTQLMGLLLLAPLAIVWQLWMRTPSRTLFLHATLLLAGLSIIHFRALALTLCMLAAITVVWAIDKPLTLVGKRLLQTMGIVVASLTLAAPWLWVLVQRILLPAVETPSDLTTGGSYARLHENLLWAGENRLLVALALGAALWGLWRRSKVTLLAIGWVCAMFLLANPWLINYILPAIGVPLLIQGIQQRHHLMILGGILLLLTNPMLLKLPHNWLITNDVVVISLFMPLGLLIGGGIALLLQRIESLRLAEWRELGYYACAVALIAFGVRGTIRLQSVINPDTVLVTKADIAALEWIKQNTPQDARFLINTVMWYPNVGRGTDGGYWIMPLTGRWSTMPPVPHIYGDPDYVEKVRQRSAHIAGFQRGQEQQIEHIIADNNITHIYFGPKTNNGPLSSDIFSNTVTYTNVYTDDGAFILAVQP